MSGPIIVINPNSNVAVTSGLDAAMEGFRRAGMPEIECVTLKEGPFGIESQLHAEQVVLPLASYIQSRPDAVQNTDEVVNLSIAPIPLINSAPRYVSGTVVNRTVRVNRRMPAIEPQFIDDDGDALNYSMFFGSRLPRGVSLDPETGVISGIPVQEGYFGNLRVVATDTAGISALSDSFNIRVNP